MAEITMVWDERVQGFTSFQTYVPESGLSLNNRHFTFKNGVIWEHNIRGVNRSTFYDSRSDSMIQVIFNDEPSIIKNFKTIGYEGSGDWDTVIRTDQESTVIDEASIPVSRTDSGNIGSDEFVSREGKNFGYIRGISQNETNLSLERISVQGLGIGTRIGTDNTIIEVPSIPNETAANATVDGIDYLGDSVFFFQKTGDDSDGNPVYGTTLNLLGTIDSIDRITNRITYTFNTFQSALQPTTDDFFLFSKDNVAETSGVIGFYGIVEFRSSDVIMAELFSINSEVIQSSK